MVIGLPACPDPVAVDAGNAGSAGDVWALVAKACSKVRPDGVVGVGVDIGVVPPPIVAPWGNPCVTWGMAGGCANLGPKMVDILGSCPGPGGRPNLDESGVKFTPGIGGGIVAGDAGAGCDATL